MDIQKEILNAQEKIRNFIRETPAEFSLYLSEMGDCRVYLKLECLQFTGSFKFRGALNKLLSLSDGQREKGIVTASTGNHGAAVAHILKKFGWKGVIYLPEDASPAKIEPLRMYGADLEFYGHDCVESEVTAKKFAEKHEQVFISPYNDIKIIAGQGTIGIELAKQVPDMDAVLVPVGGGGLISGIAGYLKSIKPDIEIIGCQPENSPVMHASIRAGEIIEMESRPTLADGTAGGIEPDAITFDLCRKYVDQFIMVSEDDIKEAIKLCLEKHYMLIEGAAALSIAAFMQERKRFENKNVVLIISGKKISLSKLKEVLCA
ncbi:threonine/serine dehydratase [Thermodesulfobacteriota bacterium]